MPILPGFPFPRRYNSLRLLGYDYHSVYKLCAITVVTEFRTPFFADLILAKNVLASLLSDETLDYLRLRAFTLMPDHLHLLAGVRQPELYLPSLIGRFKSYSTQQYWKRSRQIVESGRVCLPMGLVSRTDSNEAHPLLKAVMEWRATLRPELMELKNWPRLKPGQFLRKRLWHPRLFDHVIRNDTDLNENLEYIAMNVKAGYVTRPQFYPFTGFLF
jgi:REP element-mobilizing transposase RayT